MFEIKLKDGEGKRILGIVHPKTNKVTWLHFNPGETKTVSDELGVLVKDKRFIAKRIGPKQVQKKGVEKS